MVRWGIVDKIITISHGETRYKVFEGMRWQKIKQTMPTKLPCLVNLGNLGDRCVQQNITRKILSGFIDTFLVLGFLFYC